MSRSNPTDNAPNPSTRWFRWNGETGKISYYAKETKENVDVPDFTFVLLDQLASVRGWHEPSKSGIYSNEVRDTRQDVLVVKAFKEGTLAEGLYKDIKDRVNVAGGSFNANCYIAYKHDAGDFKIGAVAFKGAALGAWMEFSKTNRAELYKGAVKVSGFTEGKKGRVTFRVPTFSLVPLSEKTNQIAVALDTELQSYLTAYLKRTKAAQVEHVAQIGPTTEEYAVDEEPTFDPRDIAPDDIGF